MAPNRRQRREHNVTSAIEGRYAPEALALLRAHGVRVCHWRQNMSGIAWLGHPQRPIESPHPRSPLSFAILAHEVGHHAQGVVRPRWREEHLAWQFAFRAMEEHSVPLTDQVHERYARSMRYALAKAMRRGLRAIPDELLAFTEPPHEPGG